ncbi:MAG TPA: undecaprenyldiphospho-muramoylpentapeptide beta-N-acetylglucosaminyltransferase [Parasegetibacter sp.]
MSKRIIIAGGGTGGHIFPAIAIANAIKSKAPETKILFVGAEDRMEMEKVPQAGYEIKGLTIAGFNRSSLIKNISLPFKLIKSFMQVKKIFRDFPPDVVIGVGGYSSFPVLRMAQQKGIPSFIHESNSFAGKSNMMVGKKATRIFVATEGMEKFFPQEKIMITGNPVRKNISGNRIHRDEAIRFFGLNADKKTVLVTGGSLGAKGINEAIDKGVDELTKNDIQLIWQTGKPFADRAAHHAAENRNVWINSFISEMEYAYAAADIVVSRAGAMAIAELCIAKKPLILVPFPFAAEDHQTVNAMYLEKRNACVMVKDQEAGEKLIPEILKLVKDEARQEEMRRNVGMLAVDDADEKIADAILEYLND